MKDASWHSLAGAVRCEKCGHALHSADECVGISADLAHVATYIGRMSHNDADLPSQTTRGRMASSTADRYRLKGTERAKFLRACGV